MKFCFHGNISSTIKGGTIGGAEQQIHLISKYLSIKANEVFIIDKQCNDDWISDEGVKIISLNKAKKKFTPSFITHFKLLITVKADVYYCRARGWQHLLSYLASKINNSKFIIGIAHDLDTTGFVERYKYYYKYNSLIKFLKHLIHSEIIYSFLLHKADYVICQHKGQKQNLSKKGVQSYLIRNLSEYWKYQKKSIEVINEDSYLFLGSLDRRKGIDRIYEIILKSPNSSFKIVGGTRDSYSKKMIAKMVSLGNVKYLGKVSHSEAINEIIKTKAVILVSLKEGFPNIFLESWACSKQVLSLSINPDNVLNHFNLGIYFDNDIKKMIDVISNKKNAYSDMKMVEYLEKYHNPNRNVNQIIELIKA